MKEITEITSEQATAIIDSREPLGKFYLYEGGKVIGIDNERGEAWTEEFENLKECTDWLLGIEPEEEGGKNMDEFLERITNMLTFSMEAQWGDGNHISKVSQIGNSIEVSTADGKTYSLTITEKKEGEHC